MNILFYVLLAIGAYLVGSISPSTLITKYVAGIDIRKVGSGNAGSTNVLRTLNRKWSLLSLICDILKGVIGAGAGLLIFRALGGAWNGSLGGYIGGIAVILGHAYTVFYKFKGGKAVATTFGVIVVFNPILSVILLIVTFIIIYKVGYVSLASMVGYTVNFIGSIFWNNGHEGYAIFCVITTLFILFLHRNNIKLLLKGEEKKISLKKSS